MPTIPPMHELDAKDFLVQQTAEQAAREKVPLSDLEKRMMYFTESGEMREDAVALNDVFEAKYDTDEYEQKVSTLLQHAHQRISKESDAKRRTWDAAMACLRRGDHYILVMSDLHSGFSLKGIGEGENRATVVGIGIAVVVLGSFWGVQWVARRLAPPDPRVIWGVIVALVLSGLVFRSQAAKAVDWLLELLFASNKEKGRNT